MEEEKAESHKELFENEHKFYDGETAEVNQGNVLVFALNHTLSLLWLNLKMWIRVQPPLNVELDRRIWHEIFKIVEEVDNVLDPQFI